MACDVSAYVVCPTRTPPGGAALCSREAVLTTSPIAVYSVPASVPTKHLAGVDADAHPDAGASGEARRADEVAQRLLHPQRGAHRALGVVLVGDRRAEQRQDPVAEDLVDPPAERRDVVDQQLEARVDQSLHLLGIAVLGQRGEPDEVGEQHGDDAPFLALRGGDRVPARRAEPGICRNLGRAGRTQHDPLSVGQIGHWD